MDNIKINKAILATASRALLGGSTTLATYAAITDNNHSKDSIVTKKEAAWMFALGTLFGLKFGVPLALLLGTTKKLDIVI